MGLQERPGHITHVERLWMLPPFKKALEKRERETVLLAQLNECVSRLFRAATAPGLNLENIGRIGAQSILSARINDAFRLILTPLSKTELGLLYFDHHDEAYRWVDRNRPSVPTMLTRLAEVVRDTPLAAVFAHAPAVQHDEVSPIALQSARQFARMLAGGITTYLTFLDDEQRWLAELRSRGLLVIKGGAGTGKTAVAIHRLLHIARQPVAAGLPDVLYLCYNRLLAQVVGGLVDSLCHGMRPPQIEITTFHAWCADFVLQHDVHLPRLDEDACIQTIVHAVEGLPLETRAALGRYDGRFVAEEIEQVIKFNALSRLDQYLAFNRRGRRESLKQRAREAVWEVHLRAQEEQRKQDICRFSDLPLLAYQVLDTLPDPVRYRAIVIDEGQDCSPIIIRLARRLVGNGSLAVFADPAQAIYESGFQWTQRELRPAGGNVHWLYTNYRSTQEVFDLALPLLRDHDDLQEDLARLEWPERRGPRPVLVVVKDEAELEVELLERIRAELLERPIDQIGILGPNWRVLEQLGRVLTRHGLPAQVLHSADAGSHLDDATVKLVTIHSAKGWDFPVVFVAGLNADSFGGPSRAEWPATLRTFYVALTRASHSLTILAIHGNAHPVLHALDSATYDVEGSCSREWGLMHQ